MIKYFIKGTDREIEVGDSVTIVNTSTFELESMKLDSQKLDYLATQGILEKREFVKKQRPRMNVTELKLRELTSKFKTSPKEYVIKALQHDIQFAKFCKEHSQKDIDTCSVQYVAEMLNIYPEMIYQLLLRQIAIELDKQYDTNIRTCGKVFYVDTKTQSIKVLKKEEIKNYESFGGFRSYVDAKFAELVLQIFTTDLLKAMNQCHG